MDRDDKNIAHFRARSHQPKALAGIPLADINPINEYIVFDTGFGTMSDDIDDLRFKYVGVSPTITANEKICGRRMRQNCMNSGFHY
jgi:hypothetical protein